MMSLTGMFRDTTRLTRGLVFVLLMALLGACGSDGTDASSDPRDTGTASENDAGSSGSEDLGVEDIHTALDTEPDTTRPDATLSPTLDPTTYCEATVEAFCGYYLRCGRMAVDTVDQCRAAFLEACNAVYEPQYVTLAEAGHLELSRAGVEACEEHLAAVECTHQLFDLDGGCAAVWRGLVPVGGDCGPGLESFVCGEGAACVIGLDFCGACQTAVETGQVCGDGVRCGATDSCVDGVCVTRALPGASCDDGQPCVLGASCSAGVCEGFNVVALGDECDRARRCPYKSACVEGRCASTALLGERCLEAGCASGRCDDGVCVALGEVGAPCASGGDCVSGLCGGGACVEGPSGCFTP